MAVNFYEAVPDGLIKKQQ